MRFSFTGKNIVISERIKDHTEKKISRLSRLFPEDVQVNVTFSVVKQENKVEVSIPLGKRQLRAEVVSNIDMYNAIDGVVDVLERQRTKYKSQLKDRSRRNAAFKNEFVHMFSADAAIDERSDDREEDEIVIERRKTFPLKPMHPEDAIMEMEMLGHTFFVFRDATTFETNVVYKRRGTTYGLICPSSAADEE